MPVSRANNEKREITGVLVFDGQHYFQVLEGERVVVDALVAKISADYRHNCFKILDEKSVQVRAFNDFSMGYLYDTSYAERNASLLTLSGPPLFDVWERSAQLAAAADRLS